MVAAALLLAGTVTYVAAAGATGSRAQPIGLPDCLNRLVVRPTTFVVTCADDTFQLRQLQWTGWGETFTAARGQASVNDCVPSCAAGHFHSYPVIVAVAGRQSCGRRTAYRTLTYAFPAAAPFHAKTLSQATLTYSCT
jgi:hypothetical protein